MKLLLPECCQNQDRDRRRDPEQKNVVRVRGWQVAREMSLKYSMIEI